MYPLILGVSLVGVYSDVNSMFELGLLAAFGLLGYAMRKLGYPDRAAGTGACAGRCHGEGACASR